MQQNRLIEPVAVMRDPFRPVPRQCVQEELGVEPCANSTSTRKERVSKASLQWNTVRHEHDGGRHVAPEPVLRQGGRAEGERTGCLCQPGLQRHGGTINTHLLSPSVLTCIEVVFTPPNEVRPAKELCPDAAVCVCTY